MKNYIIVSLLVLCTLTGAVIEGLVEGLSAQLVQVNGVLTIICVGLFIFWTLRKQNGRL